MHHTIRTYVGVVALAGLAVACGGDDDDSAEGGSAGDTAAGVGNIAGDAGGATDATGGTTGGATGGAAGAAGNPDGTAGRTGGTAGAAGAAGVTGTGGRQTGGTGGVTGGTGGTMGGTGGVTGGTGGTTGGTGGEVVVAEWTDGPGVCPAGMPQRDIDNVEQLEAATRGEGDYAGDAPATCYLIANGTYASSSNVLFWVTTGGTAGAPRTFVGESRDGVVINARATIEADDVVIQNITFDLTGYVKSGSFNTISIEGAANTTLDHVTLTGDCQTGSTGGHIELNDTVGTVVDSCIVEYFGNCGPDGHLDHGVYLASTQDSVVRNSIIRGNASRGILFNTQQGEYGTIDGVVIENNRIYQNGHADYEDGIALNAEDTGTIANVTIQHNLIYDNYFSGLRFVGPAFSGFVVEHNTFANNGSGSTNANRSEVNLDDDGSGAGTTISRNIFAVGNRLLNNCYSSASTDFSIEDNVVFGADSTGECISGSIAADPQFADASSGDYHPNNPAVAGYGAYP